MQRGIHVTNLKYLMSRRTTATPVSTWKHLPPFSKHAVISLPSLSFRKFDFSSWCMADDWGDRSLTRSKKWWATRIQRCVSILYSWMRWRRIDLSFKPRQHRRRDHLPSSTFVNICLAHRKNASSTFVPSKALASKKPIPISKWVR